MESLKKMLKRHEGYRQFPYNDTEGILTIGYGRNLKDVGISVVEAEMLLDNDITKATRELLKHFPIYKLTPARQDVLINMAFNLGINRLLGFRKMFEAFKNNDFNRASEEMLDSKWARQVGHRATELAKIMKEGVH